MTTKTHNRRGNAVAASLAAYRGRSRGKITRSWPGEPRLGVVRHGTEWTTAKGGQPAARTRQGFDGSTPTAARPARRLETWLPTHNHRGDAARAALAVFGIGSTAVGGRLCGVRFSAATVLGVGVAAGLGVSKPTT